MITEHPSIEQLSELADGDVAPALAAEIRQHVAACVPCRATLGRLRALLEQAAALPPRIDPPAHAWQHIRAGLTRGRGTGHYPGGWVRDWGLRAAAAVLLVVGSSAATILALRSRPADQVGTGSAPVVSTSYAVPASVSAVERSYADAVEALTRTLQEQRGELAPATIATLERTLRVIDEAIAEARSALAADPSNDALLDVLAANYEQKVQLLRRASELPART